MSVDQKIPASPISNANKARQPLVDVDRYVDKVMLACKNSQSMYQRDRPNIHERGLTEYSHANEEAFSPTLKNQWENILAKTPKMKLGIDFMKKNKSTPAGTYQVKEIN